MLKTNAQCRIDRNGLEHTERFDDSGMIKLKEQIKKVHIVPVLVFVVIFTITLLVSFFWLNRKESKTFPRDEQKQIVFLGDSNIAFRRNDTDIPELVGAELSMTTYNCAFGGTTAARIDIWNRFDDYYERCCLYELTNMILAQDMVPAKDRMDSILDKYETSLNKLNLLMDMDFSKVDYLVLSYGMNDYLLGLMADNPNDPLDDKSYAGALRKSIEQFCKQYPQMKIIISSITYYQPLQGQDINTLDFGGGTLYDFRDAAKQVASEYENVYFLDQLTLLAIDSDNCAELMSDAMHLNEISQEMWAENAAELIREIEAGENGKTGTNQ